MYKLAIVVPCYNEEAILKQTTEVLLNLLEELIDRAKINPDSYILFVNDGSRDDTWDILCREHDLSKNINAISLAANVGHQNALLAGLESVMDDCDFAISLDADLQDDISVIEEMIDKYNAGADIVYGVRNDRQTDSFFKRSSAKLFYKFMSAMGVKTIENHADFRLMSARVLKQLSQYNERNLFLRGIIPSMGYKTDRVYYSRKKRTGGKSKYSLGKMIKLAGNGITSFTIRPITLITALGFIIMLLALAAFLYTLISYFTGNTEPGWSSLMISIWFLGGVQLFSIGIVGQYVGKAYFEAKQRPRYDIIENLKHK
ncbi:MAG: glycosyltransferase family 2 protein [Ruminococcaceae bacterium]|nr:glycosyltransferase family 2 protein [Oscillospiraceae bacterium]